MSNPETNIRVASFSSRVWFGYGIMLSAVTVFLLGLGGLLAKNWVHFSGMAGGGIDPATATKLVLDSMFQTLQLFVLGYDPDPGRDNWAITLARPLGALVFFAAIIRLGMELFRRKLMLARIALMKDHTVVIGFGERGKHFAKASLREGSVVIIDIEETDTARSFCHGKKCGFIHGDAQLEQTLQLAKLVAARRVIVGTGLDDRNLAVLNNVRNILSRKRKVPLEVIITIDDPRLADMITRENQIAGIGEENDPVETMIFNPASVAAQQLLRRTQFVEQAIDRKQKRVRLVIIGDSDVADEVMLQFIQLSPCLGLGKPLIERIVTDEKKARNRLAGRSPAFLPGQSGQDASTPLEWAVAWRFIAMDLTTGPVEPLIHDLQAFDDGPVTAVIIAREDPSESLEAAFSIRESFTRYAIEAGPVYVHTPMPTSLDPLFGHKQQSDMAKPNPSTNPYEIVEPYGRLDAICDPEILGSVWEKLARKIHEAYRQYKFDTDPELRKKAVHELDANMQPWSSLQETYRRANRRAAAHLPVKLASVGISIEDPARPPSIPESIIDDPVTFEALAAIEHDSWRIDRELDGWRYLDDKTRDDDRRFHPDLVPYEQLPEEIKKYDREQIKVLSSLAYTKPVKSGE